MNRWDYINMLKEMFSEEQIIDMFAYWMSQDEVKECVEDFLNDRDLEIRNGYIKGK